MSEKLCLSMSSVFPTLAPDYTQPLGSVRTFIKTLWENSNLFGFFKSWLMSLCANGSSLKQFYKH